jgi:hypothetical protein
MSMVKERKAEPGTEKPVSPPAAAVREEIERLTGNRPDSPEASEDAPRPKSYRERIQERMRELDKKPHP